jgi:membrane protein DedA with SNARE-associated domain
MLTVSPEALLNRIESLPDWAIYVALGLSAFVENLVPPIPGDTITAMGAFLVGTGRLGFAGVYISTTAGGAAGFLAIYAIGAALGRRFFLEKDFLLFRARDIIRAEAWFIRYGYFLVAINRFIPGIRSAVSLAAGLSLLRPHLIALLSLLSCAVWNGIWIVFGYTLGSRWETVEARLPTVMGRYNATVAVLGALFILSLILFRLFRRKR